MLTPETTRQLRRATWLEQPSEIPPGCRLIVLVPLTSEEMAATLCISVEQAEEIREQEPMYFCLRPRRWISPN